MALAVRSRPVRCTSCGRTSASLGRVVEGLLHASLNLLVGGGLQIRAVLEWRRLALERLAQHLLARSEVHGRGRRVVGGEVGHVWREHDGLLGTSQPRDLGLAGARLALAAASW